MVCGGGDGVWRKTCVALNWFRAANLVLVVLCFLPVIMDSEISIAENDALYQSMKSESVRAAILIVLGSAACLITDDFLYSIEGIHIAQSFVVSRRFLILSVLIPLLMMLVAMQNQDLTLYFSSFTASYALQAYSILEPIILFETTQWKRCVLMIIGTLRTWGIFAGYYRYFFDNSEEFALVSVIFYSLCTGVIFIVCIIYIANKCQAKQTSNISLTSFAFCTILNIMSRIVIPISFGVTAWPDYHGLAMAVFLFVNLPILIAATVLPGRLARHKALITQVHRNNVLASDACTACYVEAEECRAIHIS